MCKISLKVSDEEEPCIDCDEPDCKGCDSNIENDNDKDNIADPCDKCLLRFHECEKCSAKVEYTHGYKLDLQIKIWS